MYLLILVLLTSCTLLNANISFDKFLLIRFQDLLPLGDRLDSDPMVDFLDKDAVGLNSNLVNCLAVICLHII